MAFQTIGVGTVANDGTGDPLRTAYQKINANFALMVFKTDTLAASATSTVITVTGATTSSRLFGAPIAKTANAAAVLPFMSYAFTANTLTITHPSTSAVDKTFDYVAILF